MSLQLAAKHLESHGRGDDKVLVHMTPKEVKSLNDLAMAHGGQLTINPHTGLHEAGFLSAILPMVAGAGLMMIPGMQASAAGLIVGGLQTARTGSLSKGIMAGLGAYGGAGMANSFGAAGASSVPTATPSPVIPEGVANAGPSTFSDPFNVAPSVSPTAGNVATSLPSGPAGSANYMNAEAANYSLPPPTSSPPISIDGMGLNSPPSFADMNASQRLQAMKSGASFSNAGDFIANNKYTAAGTAASIASGMQKDPLKPTESDKDMGQRYSYSPGTANPIPEPDVPTYEDMLTKQGNYGRQQKYFSPAYTPISNTAAKDLYNYAAGGPVETMSNQAAMGANTMYPMANMATSSFATPYQSPVSTNMLAPTSDSGVTMGGELNMQGTRLAEGGEAESRPSYTYDSQAQKYTAGPAISEGAPDDGFLASVARSFGVQQEQQNPALKYAYNPQSRQYQQMASGGISDAGYNLGGYSDGGRLLRGPGDGVSDSIPAMIGKKQPARLADGEFVVPARIVSELGNGSTEAGARRLYAMMDRIQASRKNTIGKGKVAKNNRADKYLPA
jgi:hypothetical protein